MAAFKSGNRSCGRCHRHPCSRGVRHEVEIKSQRGAGGPAAASRGALSSDFTSHACGSLFSKYQVRKWPRHSRRSRIEGKRRPWYSKRMWRPLAPTTLSSWNPRRKSVGNSPMSSRGLPPTLRRPQPRSEEASGPHAEPASERELRAAGEAEAPAASSLERELTLDDAASAPRAPCGG